MPTWTTRPRTRKLSRSPSCRSAWATGRAAAACAADVRGTEMPTREYTYWTKPEQSEAAGPRAPWRSVGDAGLVAGAVTGEANAGVAATGTARAAVRPATASSRRVVVRGRAKACGDMGTLSDASEVSCRVRAGVPGRR